MLLGAFAFDRPAAAETRILAFGDSLIHGYGLDAGDTFPEQLETALQAEGHEVEVLNGGNSGDTSAGGRARLDWALADDPEIVILVLGANDALRGLDPAATRENLDAMLTRLEKAKAQVLLAGMRAPRNLGPDYVEAFDGIYPALAGAHGVAFYPFFLEGVALRPELNQEDGIHPNAAGVAEIVRRIRPAIEPLLQSEADETAVAD